MSMKKGIALISMLFIYFSVDAARDSLMQVIPQPVHLIKGKGVATITAQWKIYVPGTEWNNEAELFEAYLKYNYGFSLPVLNSIPRGKNIILLKKDVGDSLSKDEYHISVKQNKISITANESSGIFYGLQTLIQLLPLDSSKKIVVPQVEIEDCPRFSWRGMHLDVCRHFFSKEEVKKYIDFLARYKMNVFHWHLTDDQGWRIEIKTHPELTSTGGWRNGSMIGHYADQKFDTVRYGGFYTQDDIREVVAYAQKNHVTIVPEIE